MTSFLGENDVIRQSHVMCPKKIFVQNVPKMFFVEYVEIGGPLKAVFFIILDFYQGGGGGGGPPAPPGGAAPPPPLASGPLMGVNFVIIGLFSIEL